MSRMASRIKKTERDPRAETGEHPVVRDDVVRDNVVALPTAKESTDLDLVLDGERITVDAKREIVLRCGKASITLTRSGKIILRGTHVVSRSSGANRVLGSTVRIN